MCTINKLFHRSMKKFFLLTFFIKIVKTISSHSKSTLEPSKDHRGGEETGLKDLSGG
jgi:hypothetical protein